MVITHVGHDEDIRCCHISKSEKDQIAKKLSQGISVHRILDDIRNEFQNDASGDFNKLFASNVQDIANIAARYNIDSGHHDNDYMATEELVKEMEGDVIFYKNQYSLSDEFEYIQENDFFLILMNPYQKEMLQRFGDKIICIDSTHGLNPYDFQLTTILVLDELNEGFPVCFMFSNRLDKEAMVVLFSKIKSSIGNFCKCKTCINL